MTGLKENKNNYYIMSLLIGVSVGSTLGIIFKHPVIGVSIGSGIGVFIGGLFECSNNKKNNKVA